MGKHLNAMCLITASTIFLAAGCQSATPPQESDTATSKVEVTETERLEQTQAAAGQRAERTLYVDDFDGATLSTLGTSALDLILEDSHSCNPLVLYVEPSQDTPDRRLAIGRYLSDRGGLKPEQIVINSGTNPETNHPAAPDLDNYIKTDTGSSASTGH